MSTHEIYNFRKVNDRLITGGQPTAVQLQSAADEGFQTVVNLATYQPGHSLEDEAGLVLGLGMEYYHIPVQWDNPKESDFIEFETVMQRIGNRKTLVHCAANFRVTAFYSLYALKHLGWSEQQADDFRTSVWSGSSYPIWEAFLQKMKLLTRTNVAESIALPPAGTYAVTHYVSLVCATPDAAIYYTLDGSTPNAESTLFDPFKVIPLKSEFEGEEGRISHYTIRAVAVKEGMHSGEVMTYQYTIAPRDKSVYVSSEIHPGVHMIRDFDDDKMFLIVGSQRALLIDAGMGSGDLRGHVEAFTGGKPLDVVITHAHPDHIACLGQFQNDRRVFMHPADAPMLARFKETLQYNLDPGKFTNLSEGDTIDLGDWKLQIYEVPGHTAGSIVLFDETRGILFSGDAFGSNRPFNADSLWMQFAGMAPIDEYLSTLQGFRARLKGKIREIYTGHNDASLGEPYLDALQRAAQKFVDRGTDVLVPSLRPTDAWQVIEGDRLNDLNWAAINVRREGSLSTAPDKMADLSCLVVENARLCERFSPKRLHYTLEVFPEATQITVTPTATSSRIQRITVNGLDTPSGKPYRVDLAGGASSLKIEVTAPDGESSQAYVLDIARL